MKQLITTVIVLLFPLFIFSQDITGLWKGNMYNDSTKNSLPYELLIKKEKGKFIGFSYSRFLFGGEEYYGIKKVKIAVAKDGKIVIIDAGLIENNYPESPDKKISQLNVLDMVNRENENILEGPFVTNNTKQFREVTGYINVKRVNTFSESSLMQYFQKKGTDNGVAFVQ